MRQYQTTIVILFFFLSAAAQKKLKPVGELINIRQPGWQLVKAMVDSAKNKVEILPCDAAQARAALYKTQVTTNSPMGAIVYMTGGLMVDNGWIRILGSGSAKLTRTLPGWNEGKTNVKFGDKPAFYLVADDAIGGFFALNGGGLGPGPGKIYYLAPDDLVWEPLDLTYTDFLHFCFSSNLNEFYLGQRWADWRKEVDTLAGDKVYSFVPPLWSKEGKNVEKDARQPVPVQEQYSFNMDMRRSMGIYTGK